MTSQGTRSSWRIGWKGWQDDSARRVDRRAVCGRFAWRVGHVACVGQDHGTGRMRPAPVAARSAPVDIPKQSAPRACLPGHVLASLADGDTAPLEPTPDARRIERRVRISPIVQVRIISAEPVMPPPPPQQVAVVVPDVPSCAQKMADVGVGVCLLGVIGTVPAAIILGPVWAVMPCGFAVGLVFCTLCGSRSMSECAGEQDYVGP